MRIIQNGRVEANLEGPIRLLPSKRLLEIQLSLLCGLWANTFDEYSQEYKLFCSLSVGLPNRLPCTCIMTLQ